MIAWSRMVSHLPQLLSTALASTFAHEPDVVRVAGPAAMDLTRLALSPYDIWRDIFATNTAEIDAALAELHRPPYGNSGKSHEPFRYGKRVRQGSWSCARVTQTVLESAEALAFIRAGASASVLIC